MADALTIDALATQVRDETDTNTSDEANDTITDAKLFKWLNDGFKEFFDILAEQNADQYFVTSTTLTSPYSLPADFYRLKGVDISVGGESVPLKPFNFAERHSYTDTLYPRYRVRAATDSSNRALVFSPSTAAPSSVTLWYIAVPDDRATTETFDVINGWDAFIVAHACVKVKQALDEDWQPYQANKDRAELRIRRNAPRIDDGAYTVIEDAENLHDRFYLNRRY